MRGRRYFSERSWIEEGRWVELKREGEVSDLGGVGIEKDVVGLFDVIKLREGENEGLEGGGGVFGENIAGNLKGIGSVGGLMAEKFVFPGGGGGFVWGDFKGMELKGGGVFEGKLKVIKEGRPGVGVGF